MGHTALGPGVWGQGAARGPALLMGRTLWGVVKRCQVTAGWEFCRQLAPAGVVPIMRSSQLDASRLDEELSLMLREQFLSAFSFFPKARESCTRVGVGLGG